MFGRQQDVQSDFRLNSSWRRNESVYLTFLLNSLNHLLQISNLLIIHRPLFPQSVEDVLHCLIPKIIKFESNIRIQFFLNAFAHRDR